MHWSSTSQACVNQVQRDKTYGGGCYQLYLEQNHIEHSKGPSNTPQLAVISAAPKKQMFLHRSCLLPITPLVRVAFSKAGSLSLDIGYLLTSNCNRLVANEWKTGAGFELCWSKLWLIAASWNRFSQQVKRSCSPSEMSQHTWTQTDMCVIHKIHGKRIYTF